MQPSLHSRLRRGVKFAFLAHLAGGSLFVASCGDQIRQAFLAGVTQFVSGTTSQLVSDALGLEEVLRGLLIADDGGPNTLPIN